ncbi:MAG TPA: hypothetical protein VG755_26720 [Nannocystaceae bacterium]|nr:hypothetical protein [Nannocystaceae bacterium]
MVETKLRAHCALAATVVLGGCYDGASRDRTELSGGIATLGSSAGDAGDAGDASESGDDDGTGDDDGSAADDGSDDAASAGESDDGDTTDGDGPPIAEYGPAIDIVPIAVHVNQGVAVPVADDGVAIDPAQRTAPLVHGRRSLVFATWELAPTFVPRMIRAELLLAHADGTSEVVASEVMVDGPAGTAPEDRHFTWTLEPAQIPEGTQWSITLHELEENEPGAPPPPRLPTNGAVAFDDEDGEQRMRVVVVPYRHQYGGCNQVPPTDAATIDSFRKTMEMFYPAQSVEITVHAEVVYTDSMAVPDPVLAHTTALRGAESPDVDVYYYGLLMPCDASTTYGGYGYVPLSPEGAGEAAYRVAIGIWYDFDPQFSYVTMAHEVGHNHGREHVACSGSEAGTDPAYPIPGGLTGVVGWGIHDGVFRPSTDADYMSYCNQLWASPYGWSRTLAVLDALTAIVGTGGAPAQDGGAVLLAMHDGELTAAQYVEGLVPRRTDGAARIIGADGYPRTIAWERANVPDSTSTFVSVPMSNVELETLESLVIEHGDMTLTVPSSAIRR